ncbi:histidine kinase [Brevibacterium sp. 50QC2O2]|uniref:sensor histidine kinase n=1 Tax=Brevibacterium sp. 50QC2O2 TaxID=2968459 RepID=UPI00211C816C|nr:histidine kinase [Brevibacterium sp. 50QC2O2]MCQ9389947.1 histidine kinase [Brevibacterium sp. 50QC2O2]
MNHAEAGRERRGSGDGGPWMRYSWAIAAVWLVFIFYPVATLVGSSAAAGLRGLGWAGLSLFVVVYLLSFRLGGNAGVAAQPVPAVTWWLFALAVASAAATIPAIGDSAFSFLPFLITIAAYQLLQWFFAVVAASSVVGLFSYTAATGTWSENISLLIIVTVLCLVHLVTLFLIRRSVHAERLSRELVASEEREAIARDVHDLLGHSLTVVKLKAQLARRLIRTDPGRAESELRELDQLVAEAIAGVRTTVTGLRSEGLASQLASSVQTLGRIGIDVEVVGEESVLSPAQSLVAAWILREATTNTLRHARAHRVRIGFVPGGFEFEDDGRGLPADLTGTARGGFVPGGSAHGGNGLAGMAERATVSGARFELGASPDLGGTRVELSW